MFMLNKRKVVVYLDSGQHFTVYVKDYNVKEADGELVSYKFDELSTRFSVPLARITGMVFYNPWWHRLLSWIVN